MQLAYEVLSDDSRRATYDETGEYNQKRNKDFEESAFLFCQLVKDVIANIPDYRSRNVLDICKEKICSMIKEANGMIKEANGKKMKLEDLSKRFKKKDSKYLDILENMFKTDMMTLNGEIELHKHSCRIMELVKDIIDKYDYEVDEGIDLDAMMRIISSRVDRSASDARVYTTT